MPPQKKKALTDKGQEVSIARKQRPATAGNDTGNSAPELCEMKFRTFADFTYDWEFWLGPEREWIYTSPACKTITGYSRTDFTNDPGLFLKIIHKEDRTRVRQHLKDNFFSDSAASLEFRIITKNSKTRWIEHCCQPVHDEQGKFLGRRASNRDITQRKQVEERLLESENRFRMALDASSDGLWDRNLRTGEVFYGDNWYKLLGYTKKEAQKDRITWEGLLHPEDAEHAKTAIQSHLDGKTDRLKVEFRLRNKKGEWLWILSKGKIVEWDEEGRPTRLVGTHTEITDRKIMEMQLKKHKEELEEMVRQRTAELKETNTALNVLLRKRDSDREALEAKITENVTQLINPYFEKLRGCALTPWQNDLVQVLQESVHQLTSPFMRNVGGNLIKLSPMELQVANLVKDGKSTKEISSLLHIASGTINIHRKNIRRKIGIKNQRANLRVALQVFMKD